MATVTSLTVEKIQELLAGWESIGLSQDEINALVIQLTTNVGEFGVTLNDFLTDQLPTMQAAFEAGNLAISDLNDNVLPTLQEQLDTATTDIETLVTVDVPSLRADVNSTATNLVERPKVYIQDDAPEDPDEDDRDLVVGDTWFDSDDDNAQTIWNGTEWSTFKIDLADLSVSVAKLRSPYHIIY